MFDKLNLTRTRITVAAAAVAGAASFALASVVASAPNPSQPASNETPGDITGPCDELENADKPECAGIDPTTDDQLGATTTTSGDRPGTTTTTPVAPSSSPADPDSEVHSFDAAGAGRVRYAATGTSLTLIEAIPAPGWRVDVEQASGPEIDLDLRSGARRVQVDVEFEDGGIRERVRVRNHDGMPTEIVNGTTVGDDSGSGRSGDRG